MKTVWNARQKKITFRHSAAGKRYKFITSRNLIKKRQMRQILGIMFCDWFHSKQFYCHVIVNWVVDTYDIDERS